MIPGITENDKKTAPDTKGTEREKLPPTPEDIVKSIENSTREVMDNEESKKYFSSNIFSTASVMKSFKEEIEASRSVKPLETGFPLLDEALDGGLFPEELLVLGAISSLGKSTFIQQIGDYIALSGTPVLFVCMEMSRKEMISRTISRITYLHEFVDDLTGKYNKAKTSRGILSGYRYNESFSLGGAVSTGYSLEEKKLINDSENLYTHTIGQNMYILEGNGEINANRIADAVEYFVDKYDKAPLVIVDYLQILAPPDKYEKADIRQATDQTVAILKRTARDYKTSVIAISSLNRTNYSGKINMEAFKESGAIEYGSDILLGLQLKGASSSEFDVDEAKRKTPREIELHFLKTRNSGMSKPIFYEYLPQFNTFTEKETFHYNKEKMDKKTLVTYVSDKKSSYSASNLYKKLMRNENRESFKEQENEQLKI